MREPFKHLPFGLVVFIMVMMGMTNRMVGADTRVSVTLLALILWLGLYLLFGSNRPASKE